MPRRVVTAISNGTDMLLEAIPIRMGRSRRLQHYVEFLERLLVNELGSNRPCILIFVITARFVVAGAKDAGLFVLLMRCHKILVRLGRFSKVPEHSDSQHSH